MSRHPFDPNELGQPAIADRAASELERYAAVTGSDAPRGLENRIMAAIDDEPAARRGVLAWLLSPPGAFGGLGNFARAGALAATLVLAIAGAMFVGQVADIVRNVGAGSTATPSASPTRSSFESDAPTPSPSPEPMPGSADPSEDVNETPGPSGGSDASHQETAEPNSGDTAQESEAPSL